MSSNPEPVRVPVAAPRGLARPRKSQWRWVRRAVVVIALALLAYWLMPRTSQGSTGSATFEAVRGPLKITVLEGGNFDALESQEVKSEVQGQTKILFIVEEGSVVAQQDVDNGKILVELDSKDLLDRQTAQELDYQNAAAAFTEAKEEYEIQLNQNQSDIMTAELAAKFARMDFEKYMGVSAAKEILTKLGVNEAPVDLGTPDPPDSAPENDAEIVTPKVEFTKYADTALLGDGEAQQKLRKCEDDLLLAMKELGLSQTQFEGTERLAKKGFVTTNDLENEKLKVERNEISRKTAETAKDLFINYEFPKEAEKRLSDYLEAMRKLDRARKLALSKIAQADAKHKSADARFKLQTIRRNDLQEQIDKCKIKAERPGLVVYANEDGWRGDDRIQEGAMVRERQKIITIPDMSQMVVKVKVHEASIKSIQKGQKARIRVDAYPDEELAGAVTKVGVLPDSENRWMNPDMKVYETQIEIEGRHDWIKPGMSAQVEILVNELPDAIYVPIQAVSSSDGEKVCYVAGALGTDRCVVDTGEYNNEFIEIKSGLKEGQKVLLRAPIVPEEADKSEKNADKAEKKQTPKRDRPEAEGQEPAAQAPAEKSP